jgi:DNA polymerase (family 10)
MPIHNADIAAIFDEIADLLEIKGDNPFRVRAYRNAALTLKGLGKNVGALLDQHQDLTQLPGIGKELFTKIMEILDTGTCQTLEKLRKQMPRSLIELLRVPGLGPKRVRKLFQMLDIQTPDQLLQAARESRIRDLPGFGEKTEQHFLDTLEANLGAQRRFKLATVTLYADQLMAYLKDSPDVKEAVIAGSYRRSRATVGDLDILVTGRAGTAIMERFVSYEDVQEVLSKGITRATVILRSGLQVDLRLVPKESFGAALQYFTGSKAHNIAIRKLGRQRGLKINEYGVFKGKRRIAGRTENSVYRAVNLSYIFPELREDRGEIEAARVDLLPKPVELADLRGDLHIHTKVSDGFNTIEEMAEAGKKQGFEYIAITEHSSRLAIARGLDSRQLLQQCEVIDRLNEKIKGIMILKGIEVDILEDGRLDLPDAVLGKLDLVAGAIHSHFDLPRKRQTERILRAMDHPHFTILAHPSGRIINKREPCDVDMIRIIRKAYQRGCFLELNAHPKRLDMLDIYCQIARDEGVMVSINSDAHSILDFENLRFGIGQARRGWLEKKDVLNTRPLKQILNLLKRTM